MATTQIALDKIAESKTNPRKSFDEAALKELAASIESVGVLEPVLVRTLGKGFELVCGARRLRASKLAKKDTIPALVVSYSDEEVQEVQLIENLQRCDLHGLDEATGYQRLLKKGRSIEVLAGQIGRSIKYVYDRLKLLALIPEAQNIYREGRITAGHAILLARLKPADQKRCINPKGDGPGYRFESGLWQPEILLSMDDAERKGPYAGLKAVSVRELESWINKHVKLEASEVDQMVMPETAAVLAKAAEEKVKVLRITHATMTPPELKDGEKVILGSSWHRADGKDGSKKCEHAKLAMVVQGDERGEAFTVCVDKKKCAKHWPDHVKAAKKATKAGKQAAARGEDPGKARREAEEREHAKMLAENERWGKSAPAINKALADAIGKASANPDGPAGKLALQQVTSWRSKEAAKLMPIGKTAESLVRHLAMATVMDQRPDYGHGRTECIKIGKMLGVDVTAIVDEVMPKPAAEPKPEKKAAKKKGGAK